MARAMVSRRATDSSQETAKEAAENDDAAQAELGAAVEVSVEVSGRLGPESPAAAKLRGLATAAGTSEAFSGRSGGAPVTVAVSETVAAVSPGAARGSPDRAKSTRARAVFSVAAESRAAASAGACAVSAAAADSGRGSTARRQAQGSETARGATCGGSAADDAGGGSAARSADAGALFASALG